MKFLHSMSGAVLACLVFFAVARPAYADPHAVFYTTTGQQQLFFNMLAALNQTDYVEPVTNTVGSSTQDSRQELLDARSLPEVGFGTASDDERLTSTKTDLASVLTRNITLEGYDLWTAFQLQNRANDFHRRLADGEYARLLCQNALGVKDCDFTKKENAKLNKAIITDYVGQARAQIEDGALASFLSGTPRDQAKRDDIRKKVSKKAIPPRPYEFNPAMAASWGAVENDPEKQKMLDRIIGSALGAYAPPAVDSTYYQDFTITDGVAQPSFTLAEAAEAGTANAAGENLAGLDYTQKYITTLYRAMRNPAAVLASGEAAAYRVATEQQADQDGFTAEKSLRVVEKTGEGFLSGLTGVIGSLSTRVFSPSESRVADTLAIKNAGVVGNNSLSSAPADGLEKPGNFPLTDPASTSGGSTLGVQNRAETTTTTTTPAKGEGEVKGILDVIGGLLGGLTGLFGLYDQQKAPVEIVGPDAIVVPAHDEEGLAAALTAFDPEFSDNKVEVGYSSTLDSIIDDILDWLF